MSNSCAKITGGIAAGVTLFSSGVGAGLSAAAGATGASILKAVGLAGYDVLKATRAGAVGGAIVGVPVGMVIGCCWALRNARSSNDIKMGHILLGAALLTAAGVLGSVILYPDDAEMGLDQFAESFAVGSAVIASGAAVLKSCCC